MKESEPKLKPSYI